jgi:NADPH:quinone reductase
MRAVLCKEFGPAERLEIGERPSPEAGPGQIVMSVHACGIQFVDNRIIEGKSVLNTTKLDSHFGRPMQAGFPFVPGAEAAGVVKQVGEGVKSVKVGDRILGTGILGSMAEEVCFREVEICRIPDEMDFETAACFYVAYFTAHYSLLTRGQLHAGETLLVLGAGSGVGLASIELGKIAGARVIAAASSDEKLAEAMARGADVTIKYPRGRLSLSDQKELAGSFKAASGSQGFDVITDPVGGDYAEPAMRTMAFKGRYLCIGFAAGIPTVSMHVILNKNGSLIGIEPLTDKWLPGELPQMMAELFRWYREKRFHSLVTERYPLAQVGIALRRLADRKATGRIVLNVR